MFVCILSRLGFITIAVCDGIAGGLGWNKLVGKGTFGVNIILFEESELDAPFKREDPRVVHLLEVLRRKPGDATDVGLVNGPRGKAVLRSVCLLYTSPSPRDRTRSRMPSSA